ncbi:MAG: cell division protein SepF [Oscillospiraceae bacterium]|nr:cell division protein SepF [Oscillospiraceae bacterium]
MGATNGAKKSWLDRVFRGETIPEKDYAEKEQALEEQEDEAAMDGTYGRRPQARATPRRDNVIDMSSRAQARAAAGGGESAGGTFTRAAGSYTARESAPPAREFGGGPGGTGGGSGGGTGGGFSMAGNTAGSGEAYVIFKRLKDFTAATQVADRMTENKIVILNLESCDDETARRVLDFIGGVGYACSSMVKRIAGRVFMITPKGVSADGEFFDEVKGGVTGIYDD